MLALVMLTENNRYTVLQQFFTAGAVLTVLTFTLLLLKWGSRHRLPRFEALACLARPAKYLCPVNVICA